MIDNYLDYKDMFRYIVTLFLSIISNLDYLKLQVKKRNEIQMIISIYYLGLKQMQYQILTFFQTI